VKISQSKIDEIAAASDIVDIISRYTALKKAGRNFMGRCPFHEERTPSFSVSQEKGVYHCFGCGKSGNVFNFIMEKDNVTFYEALKILAERANIKIEFEEGNIEDRNQLQVLYEIHKKAARHFYENLAGPEGEYPRKYLSDREFDESAIKKFGLGFSLKHKDSLYKKLIAEYSIEDLLASGLIITVDKGEYKDRFRGRLMFPIFNESPKVVGFGARKLFEEGEEAKYINSPETRIYNKSRILYGLNFAKDAIKNTGYVILVEGYMDLMSLYLSGFQNVVASSGTSLTTLQVRVISRYTKEIVIVFDSDTAGKKAASRGIEIILENDLNVSVIALPPAYDPDSFIKKYGKDEFAKLLEKRKSVINYIAERFEEENKLVTPEGKTEFVRELISLIAKMKDPIKKDFYIKDIAQKFSIYENLLRKELDKYLSLRKKGLTREIEADSYSSGPAQRHEVNVSLTELMLIRLLLESDSATKEYLAESLEADFIKDPDVKKIVNYIIQNPEKPAAHLNNYFPEQRIREIINKAVLSDIFPESGLNDLPAAQQVLMQLKLMNIRNMIHETENKIKINNKYSPDITELQKQLEKLVKEKLSLEQEFRLTPRLERTR
jgi:DNA primase